MPRSGLSTDILVGVCVSERERERERGRIFLKLACLPSLSLSHTHTLSLFPGEGLDIPDYHLTERLGRKVREFCPPIKDSPALLNIFMKSGAYRLAESLIGKGLHTQTYTKRERETHTHTHAHTHS